MVRCLAHHAFAPLAFFCSKQDYSELAALTAEVERLSESLGGADAPTESLKDAEAGLSTLEGSIVRAEADVKFAAERLQRVRDEQAKHRQGVFQAQSDMSELEKQVADVAKLETAIQEACDTAKAKASQLKEVQSLVPPAQKQLQALQQAKAALTERHDGVIDRLQQEWNECKAEASALKRLLDNVHRAAQSDPHAALAEAETALDK